MSSVTISLPDVAKDLGCSIPTLREAIKQEYTAKLSDSVRFCPGGRVINTKYIVFRNIYETVRDGRAINVVSKPPIPFLTTVEWNVA